MSEFSFDCGYLSPYFINNKEGLCAEHHRPFVLVVGRKISHVADVLPILAKMEELGRPLIVIAKDVEGEALASLVVHNVRKAVHVTACKAPDVGEWQTSDWLNDVASFVGATIVGTENEPLDNVSLTKLGTASKVVMSATHTLIVRDACGFVGELNFGGHPIANIEPPIESPMNRQFFANNMLQQMHDNGEVTIIGHVGAYVESEPVFVELGTSMVPTNIQTEAITGYAWVETTAFKDNQFLHMESNGKYYVWCAVYTVSGVQNRYTRRYRPTPIVEAKQMDWCTDERGQYFDVQERMF